MEPGVGQVRSNLGLLCSMLWLTLIQLYALQKLDILVNKKGVSVLTSKKSLFFSDQERFDFKQGLNVAVAFTAYDNE